MKKSEFNKARATVKTKDAAQCHLYFWGSSNFEDGSRRVTFALSYLRDIAQEWFKPRLLGLTDNYPEWLDDWDLFVSELKNNFGPFDESADIKHELSSPYERHPMYL